MRITFLPLSLKYSAIAVAVKAPLILINTGLSDVAHTKQGLATADNDRFLRLWFEVNKKSIGFNIESIGKAKITGKKWFPYNKGGDFRKWYGNQEHVVNWENGGAEIFRNAKQDGRNVQDYHQACRRDDQREQNS